MPTSSSLPRFLHLLLSLSLLLTSVGWQQPQPAAPTIVLPAGFTDTLVTSLTAPTALAFTPDGRMLITTQAGQLRVHENGALVPTPALNLTSVAQWGRTQICANFERGLLGVAVDPDFANNQFIYVFYTYNKFNQCPTGSPTNVNNPVNRVARFELPANNVIVTTTQTVLVDNMRSPNGNHNAGDVQFGHDDYLYITIGDGGADYNGTSGSGGSNDAARDEHMLLGKVLRVTRDGDIPFDNPFQGAGTARCNTAGETITGTICQETFAWGLRNPFRFAFDPNTIGTRFFINDVGQNAWEEIDLGQGGVDYGWNCREGAHTNPSGSCNPPNMIDPIYEYSHGSCNSITGGAFVPNGVWPGYDNQYLFSDYVCGNIFVLSPGYTATTFATALGGSSAVHLAFGPYFDTQALYYTTYASGGQVRRIIYAHTPVAAISANPISGGIPLTVTLSAFGSYDPDGEPLTFDWNFGDGVTLTQQSALTLTHVYTQAGVFTATVIARDPISQTSAPASIQIYPSNTAPVPSILTPLTSTRFAVGQVITLTGVATDTEQGTLNPNALTWAVWLHHVDEVNPGDHTHPLLPLTAGNNLTFTAPPPEDLQATALSYVEVQLTATDAWGLATVITQTLLPNRVAITFTTSPLSRTLLLNSVVITAPHTVTAWEAQSLLVDVPTQTPPWWIFMAWSDGGAAAHTLFAPASANTYTATFTANILFLPVIVR